MNKHKTNASAVCAGILAFATSASAAVRTLPTPPQSEFVDRESSVVVPFPTDHCRQVVLSLSAPVSPTNAIQVALGQDLNGDEDLEPEETSLVLGVDCGEWFMRDEGRARTQAAPQSTTNGFSFENDCGGPGVSALPTCTFSFRQPKDAAARYSVAKVTTRNMAETNAVIVADIKRPGLVLIVR